MLKDKILADKILPEFFWKIFQKRLTNIIIHVNINTTNKTSDS